MDTVDRIYGYLDREGVRDIVIVRTRDETRQLRFSNNRKDLFNVWDEQYISLFGALGKRVGSTIVRPHLKLEPQLDAFISLLRKLPENPSFYGINPEVQDYSRSSAPVWEHPDIDEIAGRVIDSSVEAGSRRSTGVIYSRKSEISIKTEFNENAYVHGDLEILVRAISDYGTGQESVHYGPDSIKEVDPEGVGREAGQTAALRLKSTEGRSGRYDVLMSPYLLGNIFSYCSMYFSQESVDTHLSPFESLLQKKIGPEVLTLHDDPVDLSGGGYALFDDEGTLTRKNTIIERGVLRTFLQSYSTARRHNTRTTGNAGILSPHTWQLEIEPGTRQFSEMLSEMKNGLYVLNAWYTRFQDYRNGTFSTVPRDGVFRVEDGKVVERVGGIRINASFAQFISRIAEMSRERKRVKWWEEISPSVMPYALVRDVEISRSF